MTTKITFIPGDGIGPEISEATRMVLDATGLPLEWEVEEAGVDVYEAEGTPLPDRVVESIRRNGIGLKGPITTPVGTGFRSVNVALRKMLDLYACVRPCRAYPGARTAYRDIDLVIVRENTEDLYAGIEFREGSAEVAELISSLERLGAGTIRKDSGISIKPISRFATERIVRFAFNYARENERRKVTAVHKANIMKHTDGLFLEVAREVALDYPDIEFEDRLVDNMCMQLVQKPELYDIMVMPNLYGDLLSDLAAGLVGGLGLAPGANIGDRTALFEPTHGSAPKYRGLNKVNPMAMMLSGMMMLQYMGERSAALRLEKAIARVIEKGECVTYDMKSDRNDPTAVSTMEVAEAIIREMEQIPR